MRSNQPVADQARQLMLQQTQLPAEQAISQVIDEKFLKREPLAGEFTGLNEVELRSQALSQLQGNSVLQQFLDDDQIEEIYINRPNEVFVVRRGNQSGEPQRISVDLSAELLRSICMNLLRFSGRRVDRVTPFADASLPDGSRLHIVIPDITRQNWAVNIRKFTKNRLSLNDLQQNQTLSAAQATVLHQAVRAGRNILISGATQSGKTTLLSALLGELDERTRLISCEETFEIQSPLEDWVALQTRQASIEGEGEVALRRLVKEALRMRPDCLVVGEVREAESFDLLIAMNSGIPALCTIHANSATNAISKLKTLPLLAGPNISAAFVDALVRECVSLVVHLENRSAGRKVVEIYDVQNAKAVA